MNDKITFSHLPESRGGPFIWSHNDRGNLDLTRISDLTDTMREVVEILRERVAR